MSAPTPSRDRFHLDSACLAAHLIAEEGELFGFDGEHEHGFAAAISSRFHDAREAGAIRGPEGVEVTVYAVDHDALIVAVRESVQPAQLHWPLRQVATFAFDADEIARYGEASFEECREALAELLERANALLGGLAAIRAADATPGS